MGRSDLGILGVLCDIQKRIDRCSDCSVNHSLKMSRKSSTKCCITGCPNRKEQCSSKHFFSFPRSEERRQMWMQSTGKTLSASTHCQICEDHFDMDSDVDFFRMNGTPSLYKSAFPHRNLTSPEMALQAKLERVNWKCFVPSCENRRLMSDANVVFFAVPEGQLGKLWRAAVLEDTNFSNDTSIAELEFCCEDHFDITKDFYRKISTGTYIEYIINAGVVPSLNLSDTKVGILDDLKPKRLADKNIHPRVILNNRLSYLYGSKFPLLLQQLQTSDAVIFVEGAPTDSNGIKTEPTDDGYEYEISSQFVSNSAVSSTDTNPLELEPECPVKTESESSSDSENNSDDPEVTTDDLGSSDDESFEPDTSDEDSTDSDIVEDEATSEDEGMIQRFECQYCKQSVKHLNSHVSRAHWNFSKNVNRTRCGLCSEEFSRRKDVRQHQSTVHNGNAYACDTCNKLTRTLEDIRIHILRMHSSERTLLCQHCGKSYKFIKDLLRHEEAAHNGVKRERTHACQQCDKKFLSSYNVKKHMNSVHLNLRPYKCDVIGCSKAFKRPFDLKVHHAQVHSKENRYSCVICDKKFSLKSNLTAHMRNVHKT